MRIAVFFLFTIIIGSCQPDTMKQRNSKAHESDSLFKEKKAVYDSISDGLFRSFHPNGELKMEGNMREGKRTGIWRAFYTDGTLWSEGLYKDGLREGRSMVYHSNGVIKIKGIYQMGRKAGIWYFYSEKGILLDSADFDKPGSRPQ